jgi:hypothetical protein
LYPDDRARDSTDPSDANDDVGVTRTSIEPAVPVLIFTDSTPEAVVPREDSSQNSPLRHAAVALSRGTATKNTYPTSTDTLFGTHTPALTPNECQLRAVGIDVLPYRSRGATTAPRMLRSHVRKHLSTPHFHPVGGPKQSVAASGQLANTEKLRKVWSSLAHLRYPYYVGHLSNVCVCLMTKRSKPVVSLVACLFLRLIRALLAAGICGCVCEFISELPPVCRVVRL